MALSDVSFKLWTDTGQTISYNGLSQLTHETDLSDNPQDFTFYFGSNTASRQLQASSNPGVDNITLTPTDVLADWAATTAYTLGNRVEPTTPNTYVYECTVAGTSGGSEPTFPTASIGDTVVDGTVTWTLVAKRHELTEIKLALTELGLDSATAGAPLTIGTTIDSLVANQVDVWMRVTNAVTTVVGNTSYPEIAVYINTVVETGT